MAKTYPKIVYTEEVMREGMQIEDVAIPVEAKIALLDALSETGLRQINIGSFVSPKYTPQMACIEEIVTGFNPKPGVIYTALVLNQKGFERASQYAPPLTLIRPERPELHVHLCDIFARRNTNRSQMQEMAAWERVIDKALADGKKEAGIGINAAFGSNFLGDFPVDAAMRFLERQHALWDAVGIKVSKVSIGDPMGWCHPAKVEELFGRIKRRWPEINTWTAHFHNSRGMALLSLHSVIKLLDEGDKLHVQGTLGGVGGCPYSGNGQATGMAATEDLMHMLDGMGIETGVDLDKLIECVWMLERMIGRYAWGHVSRAGPRPVRPEELYDANAPFIETVEQATHFKLGKDRYEGGIIPWAEPITSPYLDRALSGRLTYEAEGDWPWEEDFFPKSKALIR